MKLLKLILISLVIFPVFSAKSQIYLTEGFESGIPTDWEEEYVSGSPGEPWRYRNGGNNPSDVNWIIPPEVEDIARNPPSAYEGTFNAVFYKASTENERTKLITEELDMLGGVNIELSFYLCQIPWLWEGSGTNDVLRVYYKNTPEGEWVLLHEYLDPVYDWELQTLVLPNPTSTYYVAFEGQTRWGHGTCIDNILIEEKGSQHLWIGEMTFEQLFTPVIPSGVTDLPIMRVDFKVFGNTDTIYLENINFTSLNTSDGDILTNGVKLYSTLTQTFSTENQLGSSINFVSGSASFTNLSHSLPRGKSYLWLAFDVDQNAMHGDTLDVMIPVGGILANDTLYPATDQSPEGSRIIYGTQYFEDFEGVHNWTMSGEFEVNTPDGSGGSPGNPNPTEAYSGTKVLGTDLTGQGSNPYHYEPGLSVATSYRATSPVINLLYYKNLNLFFQRHLNIEVNDTSTIEISIDDGASWNLLWKNPSNGYVNDFQWNEQYLAIPDGYSRTDQFRLRYRLGPTDGSLNFSGWNIDDIYLTGEFISKDVGVSSWIYPLSGSGHSASDSVIVYVKNYGGAEITDPVPVAYSFDGGTTWIEDNMTQSIPVGDSVSFTFPTKVDLSVPGLRPSVLARTLLPGDQYSGNDQISTQIYIVPTYTPPLQEDFETNDGFWRAMNNPVWEYGTPSGTLINSASSGTKSWMTGLAQDYGDLIAQEDQVIFEDDFDSDRGWTLFGEFERTNPSNQHPPYYDYNLFGWNCLGTDLSGLNDSLYKYENGITSGTAYTATSPPFDVTAYANLRLSYVNWIGIQAGDSVKLEISPDNGVQWHTLWKNTQGEIMDSLWEYIQIPIHDSLSFTSNLRVRFSLFHSSASGPVAEGYNIDDFKLIGDLIDSEPGYLNSPSFDLTGLHDPMIEAKLWVETEPDVDGASLDYSLDDGDTWIAVTNASGFDAYWNWYTDSTVSALGMDGWSGSSGGWFTVRHLLPAAVNGQDDVQLRFKFMADMINNDFEGIALDDVKIYDAPQDIGVLAIIEPSTACELSSNETFRLRLKNYGIHNLQAGDSIRIGYHIDRSGEIQSGEEYLYLSGSFNAGTDDYFDLSEEFDFSMPGDYQINVFTIEPDPYFYQAVANDTASKLVQVNKPYVDLGPDISTVRPDLVVLNAYSGVPGYDYLWQDLITTDSVFHVSTEGTYWVRVTNDLGCVASDTIEVMELIADVGVCTLVSPLSDCEYGTQVPIDIQIENFGTDTVEISDTLYVFGEINHSTFFSDTIYMTERFFPGDTMDFTYTQKFDFSVPGTYQMKLYTMIRDDVTGLNDTLDYPLEVYGYPDIDLGPDTVVQAAEYILSPGAGYFGYLWQDSSSLETFTVDQMGQGLYHVRVSNEHQCYSYDSVWVTLNVVDVTLDSILSPGTGCVGSNIITVSARIRNTGNQTISAGQTIDFGYMIDGGSLRQDAELLSEDFLPGDSIDFTFTESDTLQMGQWYDFEVFVDYLGDMKSWNDSIFKPVGVFEIPVVDLGEDYQVITAFEHTLDAGPGFVSYEWQDSSTLQTYLVDQIGINICSVTVTDSNGCTAYDDVVIMLAVPDVGVLEVVHPQTSCSLGTAENVQVAIKNYGNWDIYPPGDISVNYSLNGADSITENVVLADTFQNGSVIYHTFNVAEDLSTPDHYEIRANTIYTADLIPSNDTVWSGMDVYGTPLVDIREGQDSMLVYDPLTLSTASGYASYEWQDGSTDTAFSVNTPGADMYTVVVTDTNGCFAADSVYVVYDSPDIGISRIVSPVSSCELGSNETVSIEIVNNGYYRIPTDSAISITYVVDEGSPVMEEINLASALQPGQTTVLDFTGSYDFSSVASYQLDVELGYPPDENPSNDTISSEVNVWGYPSVEIGGGQDTLITDQPTTPLDAGPGFASYLWQDNSTGSTFNVNQSGLYWVVVTDDNGCSGGDTVYVKSTVHVGGLHSGGISIYPNPVQDFLYVQVEAEAESDIILEVFSVQNALVYRKDFKRTRVIATEINVQGLASGMYIMRISVDHKPYTNILIVD